METILNDFAIITDITNKKELSYCYGNKSNYIYSIEIGNKKASIVVSKRKLRTKEKKLKRINASELRRISDNFILESIKTLNANLNQILK